MTHTQNNRPLLAVILIAAYTLIMAGCAATVPAPDDAGHDDGYADMTLPEVAPVELAAGEKLAVVATTSIVGDVVANIGGEAIELTVLMKAGQDPHSYEPAPRTLVAVEDADLIFVNGLGLEEALVGSIETIATCAVVPVSAGIEPLALGEDDHDHAESDPHFWVDPTNVIVWTENIGQVLAKADPENRANYEANAESYIAQLDSLDAAIREQVAQIPAENRKLVTDHGIFGYFADEYGFEITGTVIPSFSSTSGASAGDVAGLVEIIQQENVPAIFIGTTASQGLRQLAESIAEETGREIAVLPLLTGSLAPEGEPGDTYLAYMQFNAEQIVAGLAK